MRGEPPTPEDITETMIARVFPVLTPCECKVLRWIVCAKKDSEIAVIVDCARHTVSTHVRNLLKKLGVETRVAAAMEVVRQIICRPECWGS